MKDRNHTISFDYSLEPFTVGLVAEVELVSTNTYLVKNFKVAHSQVELSLPQLQMERVRGCWVHSDSGKETVLSQAVGNAIEANCL